MFNIRFSYVSKWIASNYYLCTEDQFPVGHITIRILYGSIRWMVLFSHIDTMDCYKAWLIEMVGNLLSRFFALARMYWAEYTYHLHSSILWHTYHFNVVNFAISIPYSLQNIRSIHTKSIRSMRNAIDVLRILE